MKPKKQKKILLAVDGSDRSFETVRYVAKIPPFHKMQVVLLYVYRGVPQNYSDLGKAPQFKQSVTSTRAWEAQQKEALKEHSKKVTQILLNAGFPKEAVSVKIRHRKKGIARDIIKEAHEGYDFIVVGRKSTGKIKEIALGSVATKLVEKISDFGQPFSGNNNSPVISFFGFLHNSTSTTVSVRNYFCAYLIRFKPCFYQKAFRFIKKSADTFFSFFKAVVL